MRATSRCATSKGQTGDQQAFIVGGIAPGVSTERVWNHYYTLVVSADEETARSAIRRDTRLGFAFVAETATLKCWMRREGRLFVARRKVEGDVALMVVCTGRRHGAPLTSRRLALVNVHEALRRLAQTEPLLAAQLPSILGALGRRPFDQRTTRDVVSVMDPYVGPRLSRRLAEHLAESGCDLKRTDAVRLLRLLAARRG